MIIKTLYRVKRKDGGISITPIKPIGDYTEAYRLIADDGKLLTDGMNYYNCIDTDEPSKYTEISESSDSDYAEAGKILLGVSE